MRTGAALLVLALAGCAGILPGIVEEPLPAGPTIAFEIPDGWVRVAGTSATHYLTTGDPDVCDGVVGTCDPSTYVMERGTMDVSIQPVSDESGCAESARPTWDARVEERPDQTREATYRLRWTVCYPDSPQAMRIAADVRAGDLELRDALLGELRGFIETVVLVEGTGEFAPEK